MFTPDNAWSAGVYALNIPGILEDLAGNKIYTPFDVDSLDNPRLPGPSQTYELSFTIGAAEP